MSEWRIERVARNPVYRLFRDGQLVVDEWGVPVDYVDEGQARHVAVNWGIYGAPTIAKLRSMSDGELVQAHDLLSQEAYEWSIRP